MLVILLENLSLDFAKFEAHNACRVRKTERIFLFVRFDLTDAGLLDRFLVGTEKFR